MQRDGDGDGGGDGDRDGGEDEARNVDCGEEAPGKQGVPAREAHITGRVQKKEHDAKVECCSKI